MIFITQFLNLRIAWSSPSSSSSTFFFDTYILMDKNFVESSVEYYIFILKSKMFSV